MIQVIHAIVIWLLLAPPHRARAQDHDAGTSEWLDAAVPTPPAPPLAAPPPVPPAPPLPPAPRVTPPPRVPSPPSAEPVLDTSGGDAGAPSQPGETLASGPSEAVDVTVRGARKAGPGEFAEHGTGSKVNAPVEELAASVSVVNREAFRERGASDVQTALQLLPGIMPMSNYGGFQSAYARGFAVLTLVDGRRDSRMYGPGETPFPGLYDLDRIEVLRGASSALYGYGAVGGTMNLIRRRASATALHELELGVGTPRQYRAHLGSQGGIAPKLSYRADLGHTSTRNFRGYEVAQTQATSTLRYAPTHRHTLQLRTSLAFNRTNTDSGIPTIEDPARPGRWRLPPDTRYANRYNSDNDYLRFQRLEVGLDYRYDIASAWYFEARASVGRDRYGDVNTDSLTYVGPTGDQPAQVSRGYYNFDHTFRPMFAQLELHGDLKTGSVRHQLVLGYQLDHLVGQTDLYKAAAPPPVDFVYPLDDAPRLANQRDRADYRNHLLQSFYVFDHVQLTRMLILTGGGRLDAVLSRTRRAFFDLTSQDEIADPTSNAFRRTNRTVDLAGSGQVGLVFRPVEPIIGYVSYANGYRPQFVRSGATRVMHYKAERSHQLEGGVRLRVDRRAHVLEVDAAAYLIRKKNLLSARGPEEQVAAGLAQSRGADLSLQYAALGLVHVTGSYARIDAEYRDFLAPSAADPRRIVDLAGKALRNAPRHAGNLWFRLTPRERLNVGVGSRFVGVVYADDENRLRIPRYALLDASMSYGAGRFTFTLVANNLANKTDSFNSIIYYWSNPQITPGPGREISALARIEL